MDVPAQITLDDAIADVERQQLLAGVGDHLDEVVGMERLGDSDSFGYVVIDLLERVGWLVHVAAPFAGAIDDKGTRGVMVIARHPDLDQVEIKTTGRTVADCATPIMIEADKYTRALANARRRREEAAAS